MPHHILMFLQCGCFGFSKPRKSWKAQARTRSKNLTEQMLEHVIDAAAGAVQSWNPDEWKMVRSLQEEPPSDSLDPFEESHPQSSEKPWVEIGLLRYLNAAGFPYVCDLFGIFRDDEFTYVATSLATDGDLFSFVERLQMEPGPEREGIIRPMMDQVFSAVSGGLQLQLIDFGMATLSRKCSEIRGKKAYQAPEMHTDISYDSYLSDDFALGVVLYAMALSDYPWISTRLGTCKLFEFIHMWGFREFIKKRTCKKGVSPRIVEVLSPELAELLEGLLELHPEERLCLGESCYDDGVQWSAWNMAWLSGSPTERRCIWVSLAQRRVTVSVPATVANLGPGLEVVGMAVDIWDEFTLEFSDHFSVELRGPDSPEVPRNEENLVVQGAANAFKDACRPFPTMRFICEHRIPYDKGLGAASASFVGGYLAGSVLCAEEPRYSAAGTDLPPTEELRHLPPTEAKRRDRANSREVLDVVDCQAPTNVAGVEALLQAAIARGWNPGNVCPAIYGALQIGIHTPSGMRSHRVPIPHGLVLCLFVPDGKEEDVGLDIEMVERQKAIFNVGRCALLINVFCTQEFSKFQKFQKAGFADVSIGFGGARYPTNGEGNLGEYVGNTTRQELATSK
eukprot:g33734.t1